MTSSGESVCEQCGLTPEQAKHKKSVEDHQSFAPVVARVDEQERIELHWVGWGGPIDSLPPLCRLTRAQATRLLQDLTVTLNPLAGGIRGLDDA